MAELQTPLYDVILDNGAGETTTHRVQIVNADLVRYDRTAAKHGWPGLAAAPSLWGTFVCWSAMRRTGDLPSDYRYETFEERALSIWPVKAAGVNIAELVGVSLNGTDELADIADPTQPAAEGG